jgi:hypothetical protein
MSATLAAPPDAIKPNITQPSKSREEASRANGRLSRGPTTPEGKARSRQNGCRDGLTGAGIVLPPAAAAEVDRREAEFVRDFRPRNAIERELVRQMALGAWRTQELSVRIFQHDARANAARFVHWEQDEQIAAVELGRRLGDAPELVVAQLKRTSAGCDWMIGRWELLENALSADDDGGPGCAWTDADLELVLNLLGRPLELRRLDGWVRRLESLRAEARSGSDKAAVELREIVAEQFAKLEERRDEAWEGVEQPRLQDWRSGLELDLGPEGTRLRRYEAAAERLFRSAWTKLERLRKESGEPLIFKTTREHVPWSDPAAAADAPRVHSSSPRTPDTPIAPPVVAAPVAAPAPAPAAPAPAPTALPAFTMPELLAPSLDLLAPSLLEKPSPVLDFWVAGPPRGRSSPANPSRNKTNPAPGRSTKAGQTDPRRNLL